MSVAITLALFVLNFGVGGWAVWRVNRMLPKQLTLSGKSRRFNGWGIRFFVWSVVFLVATSPIFVAAQVVAALMSR